MLRTVLLLAGAALLGVLLWRLGPADIFALVGRVGWAFVPAVGLYTLHHVVRALALQACVPRQGLLGYGDALAVRLSGEAIQSLTFSGPVLAEPARAWMLTRRGLTLQEGLAATVTEYLISAFVTAALSIGGLLYIVRAYNPPPSLAGASIVVAALFAAFLAAAAVAVARRLYLIGTIVGGLSRLGVLRGRLRPDMAWVNRTEDLLLAVLRDRPALLGRVLLIEVAAQVPLVMELFVLLRALDVGATPLSPILIEASAKTIGIVFMFVPQQMGVAEGTYALIFDVLALPAAAGFAVALLRRIRALVVTAIGLMLLARLTRRPLVPS
ncbi:MAG: flippase-like domain-containing protein [Acidobacteria bacterium]|nr:flippase-like domain-containing protein [Acidobacteriota bacterium]